MFKHIKRFIGDIISMNICLGVFDNLHKVHGIRTFICWMGRHDYEAGYCGSTSLGKYVDLYCFYCKKQKRSYMEHQ